MPKARERSKKPLEKTVRKPAPRRRPTPRVAASAPVTAALSLATSHLHERLSVVGVVQVIVVVKRGALKASAIAAGPQAAFAAARAPTGLGAVARLSRHFVFSPYSQEAAFFQPELAASSFRALGVAGAAKAHLEEPTLRARQALASRFYLTSA